VPEEEEDEWVVDHYLCLESDDEDDDVFLPGDSEHLLAGRQPYASVHLDSMAVETLYADEEFVRDSWSPFDANDDPYQAARYDDDFDEDAQEWDYPSEEDAFYGGSSSDSDPYNSEADSSGASDGREFADYW
jgi:hypothetical protein